MRTICTLVLLVASGCTVKDPLFCETPDHPCTDPSRPFCDENAAFPASEGIRKTCIPSPFDAAVVDARPQACTPNTKLCAAGIYAECDPLGQVSSSISCGPLGCNLAGTACVDIDPTNGLATQLDLAAAAPEVALTGIAKIDTSTSSVVNGNGASVSVPTATISQGLGLPSITVFRFKSLSVESLIIGGANTLALVSDGDITISGNVDLSSSNDGPPLYAPKNGPGALISGNACVGQKASGKGGGGGGGRGDTGASGGDGGGAGAGAGGAKLDAPSGAPLVGGCMGGIGAGDTLAFAGAAGGGIQLTSRTRIRLQGTATIDASGGGGRGAGLTGVGGGGGGAGGSILLEAPIVDVSASGVVLSARGGGGASSAGQTTNSAAMPGSDGDADPGTTGAAGGSCSGCAAGGVGQAVIWTQSKTILDGAGPGANGTVCGGGGGGASGQLVIKTATGTLTVGAVVRAWTKLSAISTRDRTK